MEDRGQMFAQKAKTALKDFLSAGRMLRPPVNDTQIHFESAGNTNKESDTVRTRTPQKKTPPSLRKYENHKRTEKAKEDHHFSKVTYHFLKV